MNYGAIKLEINKYLPNFFTRIYFQLYRLLISDPLFIRADSTLFSDSLSSIAAR